MQDRGMIEGLVLSCIYQDLTLVTELEPDFFSTNKSIFYFVLAREMSKTIKEVFVHGVTQMVYCKYLKVMVDMKV